MTITYGSICSGIEAATVAWHPLGWHAEWFAEIEPFPSAVLAYRWPDVSNLGDMTKLARQVLAGSIAAPEVLVGGTPCQAFSVAGMRAGLDDPRGQLTIKYVELADAVDHVRPAGDECIVVWENVPGVLSDKGNAFGCFLGALVGESDAIQPSGGKWTDAGCVYGPKRSAAWRVLDAQYFGLAQRRRRVFVVASARTGFDPAAVLFEREGMRRDTAPRREAGQGVAGCAADSAGSRGNGRDIAPTLDATMDRKWGSNQWANNGFAIIEPVIMSSGQANAEICADGGAPVLTCLHEAQIVVHGTQDPDVRYDQAHALGRNSGQENAVLSVALHGRDGGATAELGDEVAGCLRASTGGGDKAHVLAPTTFAIQAGALRTNPNSGPDGVGVQADHAYTLEARAEVQAVAITQYGETAGTLTARHDSSPCADRGMNVVAHDILGTLATEVAKETDVHTPLRARKPGQFENSTVTVIQQQSSAVRRLTPRECERLQGFPDVRKTFTMSVSFDGGADECSGHQKSFVSAETKNLRSQSNALHADESEFQSAARVAGLSLNAGQASSSEPVLVSALIDLERQHLQLRSAGRLLLSVNTAEQSEWCRLPISRADFAQLIARMHTFADSTILHGVEGSPQSTTCSTHRRNGSVFAQLCGHAISELVSDAEMFTNALRECLKSTISEAGQNSQNCDLTRGTLFSCVAAVICSFIPEKIQSGNSFALNIETVQGYTLIPWRNKPAEDCPDGPRYKAIGNSKAVPVVRWIGRRIQQQL